MAFALFRRAFSQRCQVLVLGLLLSLLLFPPRDTQAFECETNIRYDGEVDLIYTSRETCPEDGHHACFSMDLFETEWATTPFGTVKGCQHLSGSTLHCLSQHLVVPDGREENYKFEANCVTFLWMPGWEKQVARCGFEEPRKMSLPGGIGKMRLCTCNEGDNCNQDCKCNVNYGPCGSKACQSYPCYCAGESPALEKLFPGTCTSGEKPCPGLQNENTGCYLLSQEGSQQVFKDCALAPVLLQCIHNRTAVKGVGPGDCFVGTNDDWYKAAVECGWKDPSATATARQLPNTDRKARMKACHCNERFCNRGSISWEEREPPTTPGPNTTTTPTTPTEEDLFDGDGASNLEKDKCGLWA